MTQLSCERTLVCASMFVMQRTCQKRIPHYPPLPERTNYASADDTQEPVEQGEETDELDLTFSLASCARSAHESSGVFILATLDCTKHNLTCPP